MVESKPAPKESSSTGAQTRRGSRNDLILDALLRELAKERGMSKEQYVTHLVPDDEDDDA